MIIVNGKRYEGNSIVMNNGRVVIDGNDMTPDAKEINITIEGNLETLEVDYVKKIVIGGDVNSVRTSSGDVEVGGMIKGNVSTSSGNVESDSKVAGVATTALATVTTTIVNTPDEGIIEL